MNRDEVSKSVVMASLCASFCRVKGTSTLGPHRNAVPASVPLLFSLKNKVTVKFHLRSLSSHDFPKVYTENGLIEKSNK